LNGSEDYHAATDSFQRAMISQAMAEANANPQEAAKLLGLSRHALRHQMTKLGLLKS